MRSADDIDIHVGKQLRFRRNALGLSQGDIAKELGLTFQQIQKYEKGQNRIGAGRLYRIASILAVSVAYFYEGIGDEGEISALAATPVLGGDLKALALSAEGRALLSAFNSIEDEATRRQLLDLIKILASKDPS